MTFVHGAEWCPSLCEHVISCQSPPELRGDCHRVGGTVPRCGPVERNI